MPPRNLHNHPEPRTIKTARTIDEINAAAKMGYLPLVKPIEPSPDIRSKYKIVQNKLSGEIKVLGDFRSEASPDWETVIDWTYYYPNKWDNPFAAYLVPNDIKVGEVVILEDLIEDFVGFSWNQGDTHRLDTCEATWTGSDFIIDYDPKRDSDYVVG